MRVRTNWWSRDRKDVNPHWVELQHRDIVGIISIENFFIISNRIIRLLSDLHQP